MPDPRDPRLVEAERALNRIREGARPSAVESETLDCKEDPSQRAGDGSPTLGEPQSEAAATLLAEAAACRANHEGGAVVVGLVDDQEGPEALVGTSVDADWLANRIRELTTPPLTVRVLERREEEARLLILLVPRNSSSEP